MKRIAINVSLKLIGSFYEKDSLIKIMAKLVLEVQRVEMRKHKTLTIF